MAESGNSQNQEVTQEEIAHLQEAPKRKKKHEIKMLPPIEPIVVAKPGTIKQPVTQDRLQEFYKLQESFYKLRDKYIRQYRQLQDLILKGAAIRTGEYKVEHGVRFVRRPRYKQVVIDLKGEAYQQRVLEHTPPNAYFRVRVK